MKRLLCAVLIIGLIAICSSCTKLNGEDDVAPEIITVATISFSSPVSNTVFRNGDSVNVKAIAISTADIHGYDVSIRKAGDTTVTYYFNHIHDHNDTVKVDEKWKSIVAAPTNLEAEITLYLDHSGQTKKDRVVFRVQ